MEQSLIVLIIVLSIHIKKLILIPYLVINQAPAPTLDGIRVNVQANTTSLATFKINLSDEQKKGARTMAGGREGYARMVSQICTNNVNSLPRDFNPTDLVSKLAYDSKLEEVRQAVMTLMETITETQMANSMDIMKMVDDSVNVLQVSRNNSAALDLAMREVDEWNARFANRNDNTNPTPNA